MNDNTIKIFKEISKIPRESGNEEQISNYVCEFAKKNNLEFFKDQYNNVIVKKNNGKNIPIILQAHLDMVCEKNNNIEIDFNTQPIKVIEEDGYLKANGTTLGADNGIGVAQILNILESDMKINIEAIFTVSEETTMVGAENLDVSELRGKKLINLDGFEEETIIIESAGFWDIILNTKFTKKIQRSQNMYSIRLSGLEGGHSGFEIDKDKGNSTIQLAQLLEAFGDIELSEFNGGTKFNVIPSEAQSIFYYNKNIESLNEIIEKWIQRKKKQYKNIKIELEIYNDKSMYTISKEDTNKFINAIKNFKHGVWKKNEYNEVTTSQNLGVVNLSENVFKIGMRSSRRKEADEILNYIEEYSRENEFEFKILGNQPGFETNENSELIKNLISAYEKVYKIKKLKVKPVHITVEVGFIKNKIEDLEVAIISPKIIGAHTPNEKVEIESIKKCDSWLWDFLENEIID